MSLKDGSTLVAALTRFLYVCRCKAKVVVDMIEILILVCPSDSESHCGHCFLARPSALLCV